MKPNFDDMSKAELKAYVLSHRDDDEAIRVLFSRRNPPDSEATWYGPMSTPEGVPIEENIRIAEEAIRQRAKRDREKQREKELQKERELEIRLRQKIEQEVEARLRREIQQERVSYGEDNMTTVTPEEIEQFREQLREYPEAIAALDVIQQCDGYVEDAVTLLMMRETGQQPDRGVREWLQKCRTAICQEDVKEALASGLIAPAIEPLAISTGFPPGTATALGILAFKIGIKKLCDSPSSEF
ncbi:MAG TPA: hypothetical protein V6C90_12250 [Coleofasciculaceae cyanobacterium]|jgi:hypothetical protein